MKSAVIAKSLVLNLKYNVKGICLLAFLKKVLQKVVLLAIDSRSNMALLLASQNALHNSVVYTELNTILLFVLR